MNLRNITVLGALTAVLSVAQDVPRTKNREKFAPDFAGWEGGRVIVQFHDAVDARALSTKAARRFSKVNVETGTAEASVDAAGLAELADQPEVAYITPDRELGAAQSLQVGIHEVRALTRLRGYDSHVSGEGVGVAIIDSGINSNSPFLKNRDCTAHRVVYSQNFVPGETVTSDPYGHGTHVAGILSANGACLGRATGADTSNFSGTAHGVNLINLRALNRAGKGTDSTVIAAIDRAIALRSTYNIRVLNLSLGRPIRESFSRDPLCQAVERAWKAGILVVVAAGNNGRDNSMKTSGYSTISSPGNDPYVLTVGATRQAVATGFGVREDHTMASYSSKGPALLDQVVKPDLVAPGNLVNAPLPATSELARIYPGNKTDVSMNNYWITGIFRLSGTSMAAPVVSGVAALLIQKDSTLTPDQIKARLMKTAWKGFAPSASILDRTSNQRFNIQQDIFTIGAGMVDADAALKNAEKIPATSRALSPRVIRSNGAVRLTNAYSGITGVNVVWGSNVVWGENVVWGSNVVWGENVVWGSNVVWGESNTFGSNIVWGTSVVWGESAPFSESLAVNGDN